MSAAILPFPASSRVGKIRRTAEILSEQRTQTGADRYWQQVIAPMERQMRAACIDDETIQHELRSFFDAVQGELHRMAYQHQQPDDAA